MASGSVCKNHPSRKTARRCFQCTQPICAGCTLHLDRHYFCSEECHAAWLETPKPQRISKKERAKARRRKNRVAAEQPPRAPVPIAETAAAAAATEPEPPPFPASETPVETAADAAAPEIPPGDIAVHPEEPDPQAASNPAELTLLPPASANSELAGDPASTPQAGPHQPDPGQPSAVPEHQAEAPEGNADTVSARREEQRLQAPPAAPLAVTVAPADDPISDEAASDLDAALALHDALDGPSLPEFTAADLYTALQAPDSAPAASAPGDKGADHHPAAQSTTVSQNPQQAEAGPLPPPRIREPIVVRQAAPDRYRNWFFAAFALNIVAVMLLVALYLEKRPADEETFAAHLHAVQDTLRAAALPPPPPALDAAPSETTATAIVIRGEAPGATSVTVLLNGVELTEVKRTGDRFETPAHALEAGINVVQVRAGVAGDPYPRFSLAHLVRRIPEPARPEQSLQLKLPPLRDISRGNPVRNAVSFTFDGGSEANAATEILQTLRHLGIKTTLFLTGEFIRKFPDIVRQAAADGHEIGNHSFTHPHLTTYNQNGRHDTLPHVTEAFFKKQLADTENAYREITGQPMAPFWRAPYGEVNAQLQAWAAEQGYRHVGWTRRVGSVSTLDSLDWVEDKDSSLYLSGTQLKRRFVSLVEQNRDAVNGGIFLMHLGTERKTDKIHWQLADILTAYQNAGFEIVPVSQLVSQVAR